MKTFKKIFTVFTLIITLFSQDNNYFNFEEDKMGWAPHYDPADHMQITNVIWNNNPSYTFLGNGSIEVQFDDMVAVENKPNDRGHAEVALSNFAPYNFPPGQPYYNLSNETLQIRFLVPAAHWDPNIEVYLVLKSTNDNWTWYRDYGPFNAGTGVTADVWYETNITLGVTPYNFSDATFNMSRVYRMGIKISAQSAGGVDAGSVYLDSWHWGGDNAPPFISNLAFPEAMIANTGCELSVLVGDNDYYTAQYDDILARFKFSGIDPQHYSKWAPDENDLIIEYSPDGNTVPHLNISRTTMNFNLGGGNKGASYTGYAQAEDTNGATTPWFPYTNRKVYVGAYPDPGRYNFEEGNEGWRKLQEGVMYNNTTHAQSSAQTFLGSYSLELAVSADNSEGAGVYSYNNVDRNVPDGNEVVEVGSEKPPYYLNGKQFVIWVYASSNLYHPSNSVALWGAVSGVNSGNNFSQPVNIPFANAWFPVVATEGQNGWSITDMEQVGFAFFNNSGTTVNGNIYIDTLMFNNGRPDNDHNPDPAVINCTNYAPAGTPVNAAMQISDPRQDHLLAVVTWGDGAQNIGNWTTNNAQLNFNHTFSANGSYDMQFITLDPGGGISVITQQITVGMVTGDLFIQETNTSQNQAISGIYSLKGLVSNANSLEDPIAVFLNSSLVAGGLSAAAPQWTTNIDTTALTDGSYIFTFTASNSSGTTAVYNQTNIIDNSPPAGSITAPVNNALLSGSAGLNGTASDPDSGISKAVITITNNAGTTVFSQNVSGSPWNTSWDTTGAANGNYGILLRLTNNAGGGSLADSLKVTVDNSKLIFGLDNYPAGWHSGSYTLSGYATNTYSVNDPNLISNNTGSGWNYLATGIRFTNILDTTSLNDGSHVIQFFAVSTINGRSSNFSTVINIDNSPPKIFLVNAASNRVLYETAPLDITIDEPHAPVTYARMLLSNTADNSVAPVILNNNSPALSSFNTTAYANGDYVMFLTCSNATGLGYTTNYRFTIKNIAWGPVLTGPNPLSLQHNSRLYIQGLTWSSAVKIFNINGKLIKSFDSRDLQQEFENNMSAAGQLSWNLKNDPVSLASGIYIIQISDPRQNQPVLQKISVSR